MVDADLRKGMVVRYVGDVHRYMRGYKVKLLHPILDDNDRPTGRWDAAPWIEKENRFSWVTSDVRPDELEPLDGEDRA